MSGRENAIWRLTACCLGLLVFAIMGAAPAFGEGLRIVTTTSDLASLAKSIAGEHGKVESICTGKEDPHFIQAKPGYILMARTADLWIRVGMELEVGWEGPILDGARNRGIRVGSRGHLDASENVLRLEVPTERVTRAMGDVHPMGNPHYWLDPLNARIVAKTIADRLAELDPQHAEEFRRNLVTFQRALDDRMFGTQLVEAVGGDKLWALQTSGELPGFLERQKLWDKAGGWTARMRPFRGRKIVTYHRSWGYFANRFGLQVAAELEPKPGIPPSPSHLADAIRLVKVENIQVILQEPFYSRKAADRVATGTDAKVVIVANSVGGQAGADDYLGLIDLIGNSLANALQATAEKK